ncbi:unnamed protein product, partial [Didymodactylos carnosus]
IWEQFADGICGGKQPTITNAVMTPYQNMLTVVCSQGYIFADGSPTKFFFCIDNNWKSIDNSVVECQQVTCKTDLVIPHAMLLSQNIQKLQVSYGEIAWSGVLSYRCMPGTQNPLGSNEFTIECQHGRIVSPIVSCQNVSMCTGIPSSNYTTINYPRSNVTRVLSDPPTFAIASFFTLECLSFTRLIPTTGSLVSVCQPNAQWSSYPKCEVRQCPPSIAPPNIELKSTRLTILNHDSDHAMPGSVIEYVCREQNKNVLSIICNENGTWSPYSPCK